jgi:anti-anti-sigma factor
MNPVTVQVRDNGHQTVLHVAGELDMLGAPVLAECVAEILRAGPPTLVVDLTEVDFLGSAGLAAMVEAGQRAGTRTQLRIVASTRSTLRPFTVTGLHTQFSIYPDLGSALRDGTDKSIVD